jgi:hypothetical protein
MALTSCNSKKVISIAHIINPVAVPAYSELWYAQPITFETMRVAANNTSAEVSVELLTAQFQEDISVIPSFFRKTRNLERSVLDCGMFKFPVKFPLLQDVLDRLYNESNAEYLVYTNVDIALQPHFYSAIANKIRQGLDAFIINRRRIPADFKKLEDLPSMYNSKGAPHPGFDCFVFHRSLYPKFELEHVCIGIPFIEITFSQNLFCFAQNFKLFDRDFLTFHIGMQIFKKRDKEYLKFNKKEYKKAVKKLWPFLDNKKFPFGNRNIVYRMIQWGLHPAIPIRLALQLEFRRWKK